MLQAAKQLAINPKDPPTYQMYSNHSKSVSDAIKRLVSAIRYVQSTGLSICCGTKGTQTGTCSTSCQTNKA